jgi:uncharacterized protein YdeI (YjbR/CyaY-like superfamily)
MSVKETPTFYPQNIQEWRQWLAENHLQMEAVWLVMVKKQAKLPTISWSEAVDEALCFGWIDSVKKKLDDNRSIQFFCKRKSKSTWSRINKQKVQILIDQGKMMPAGLEIIKIAQQNGSWTLLDEVEDLIIPNDLEQAFTQYEGSMEFFQNLSKSAKKLMLSWIVLARQPVTRQNRIDKIAEHAGRGQLVKF